MTDAIALAIMCKAPAAGRSKTRLCPPLRADEAAALSACFIADVAVSIAAVPAGLGARGYAVVAPAGGRAAVAGLLPPGFAVLAQRGADLSARLVNATRDLLALGNAGVCLINADGPTLPVGLLAAATAVIRAERDGIVIAPAIDGGYALIGLSREEPRLFVDIAWSTSQVLTQTLARAAALDVPVRLLPTWYDVDEPASLDLLLAELFGGERFALSREGLARGDAARTRHFLAALLDGDDRRRGFARASPEAKRRPPTAR